MEQTALSIPIERTVGPWPPGFDLAKCRSCSAPIRWAVVVDALSGRPLRNEKTGKIVKVPLDLDLAAPDATHVLTPARGHVRRRARGELGVDPLSLVRNHFRTCPHANRHTRRTP